MTALHPQTRPHLTPEHIRQSNLIEGIDDLTADGVGEAAWCWLLTFDTVTPDVVCQLHRIVTAAQTDLLPAERGRWRTCDVTVGGRLCLPHSEVRDEMDLWCGLLNAYSSSSVPAFQPHGHHVTFEKIHPFVDGNGRTGRLLMWWHEIRRGEQPTLLRASERHAYYRWFR